MFSFKVTKRKNIIQVDVDTEGNSTVGPSQLPAPSARATFYMGGLPGEVGRCPLEQNTPKPGEMQLHVQD